MITSPAPRSTWPTSRSGYRYTGGASSTSKSPPHPTSRPGTRGCATVRRSATTFDPEGCPLTRLSVSTKLELEASGAAEGARAGDTCSPDPYEKLGVEVRSRELPDGEWGDPTPVGLEGDELQPLERRTSDALVVFAMAEDDIQMYTQR